MNKSTDVERVHEMIGKDLNLSSLDLQFSEICGSAAAKELNFYKMVKYLCSVERNQYFREISILFARIYACTPHS